MFLFAMELLFPLLLVVTYLYFLFAYKRRARKYFCGIYHFLSKLLFYYRGLKERD